MITDRLKTIDLKFILVCVVLVFSLVYVVWVRYFKPAPVPVGVMVNALKSEVVKDKPKSQITAKVQVYENNTKLKKELDLPKEIIQDPKEYLIDSRTIPPASNNTTTATHRIVTGKQIGRAHV